MQARANEAGRGVMINLRADERKRALIDRAADAIGKNRSEFMLEAACRAAETVLLIGVFSCWMTKHSSGLPMRWISRQRITRDSADCSRQKLPGSDEPERRQDQRA